MTRRFVKINSAGILTLLTMFGSVLLACTKQSADTIPAVNIVMTSAKDTLPLNYLALGDSYTIGQSVAETERFPVQVVQQFHAAGYKLAKTEIIATTGWTTTNLQDAIKAKPLVSGYQLVSLLIGVNNQYQRLSIDDYRTEFTDLLKTAIRLAGDKPNRVFVLSIPDYSVTPFAAGSDKKKIALEIDAFNDINLQVATAYSVHYLDITGESRKAAADPSLVARDGLHFSGKAYGIWAMKLFPLMVESLK